MTSPESEHSSAPEMRKVLVSPCEGRLDGRLRPLRGHRVLTKRAQQTLVRNVAAVRARHHPPDPIRDRLEEGDRDHQRESGHDRQVDGEDVPRDQLEADQQGDVGRDAEPDHQ